MNKKDKKIILEGILQKFDSINSGRVYPVETLEAAAERYKLTIAGGTNALIEHYENYYEKTYSYNPSKASYYLYKAIKLRMIKINKDYCTCII